MNAKRLIIAAGSALALSAALLPATASAARSRSLRPAAGLRLRIRQTRPRAWPPQALDARVLCPTAPRVLSRAGVRGALPPLRPGAGLCPAAPGLLPAFRQRLHHHLARGLVTRRRIPHAVSVVESRHRCGTLIPHEASFSCQHPCADACDGRPRPREGQGRAFRRRCCRGARPARYRRTCAVGPTAATAG